MFRWILPLVGLLSFATVLLVSGPLVLHAEQANITQSDVGNVIHAQTIAASGTFTQTRAFTGLPRSTNQSVQVQGTGTSPNYKVEMLITLEGTVFTKPETGGDLGTFTDQNPHIIAVSTPACVGSKLKITELSGANPITIEAYELSQ